MEPISVFKILSGYKNAININKFVTVAACASNFKINSFTNTIILISV